MERFIEDEEVGGFDESTGEEAETLFTAADAEEGAVFQMLDAEAAHPQQTGLALFRTRTDVEAHAVM